MRGSSTDNAWTYPKSYSVRPLTMQKGMIRANGIYTVWNDGVDIIYGMTLGASIGVTLDFAGDPIFVLPTDTPFALEVALPFRIKSTDRLSVDTGIEVRGTLPRPRTAKVSRSPSVSVPVALGRKKTSISSISSPGLRSRS